MSLRNVLFGHTLSQLLSYKLVDFTTFVAKCSSVLSLSSKEHLQVSDLFLLRFIYVYINISNHCTCKSNAFDNLSSSLQAFLSSFRNRKKEFNCAFLSDRKVYK